MAEIIGNVIESSINLRTTIIDGVYYTKKVGNFDEVGKITLYGDYTQNSVELPKYDLSNIVSLDTNIANFNFILSLKDGDIEPELFVSKDVMSELLEKYNNSDPIYVNYLINQLKLVVVDISLLNQLTERMREAELSIDLNNKKKIEVTRNLYTYSNYTSDNDNELVATPSYDLNELIKYITWVVTKPNPNYDERLIPANELGDWVGGITTSTETVADEPSTNTTNIPDTDTQSGNIGSGNIGSGNTGSGNTGSGNQTDTGFGDGDNTGAIGFN